MDYQQRHSRVRLLVKELNKQRKSQAKKVDILCNDFITAQREFIEMLNAVSFAAYFNEAVIGITDLGRLLSTAGELIKGEIAEANVAFFLRQEDSFKLQVFESEKPIPFEKKHLENCFTAELMDDVCKSNRLCGLDDMFAMGLQGNLVELKKITAFTIPLSLLGRSLGFILIYRPSQNKLGASELSRVSCVSAALARAIQACPKF